MGTVALGARFIIRLQFGLKIEPCKYVIIVLLLLWDPNHL